MFYFIKNTRLGGEQLNVMKEKNYKRIKISLFISSVLIFLFSVSYAFINMSLTGMKRQVITSGDLK